MSQETKYQDWSLRLAMALPVLLIVFVAGAIYIPRLWAEPAQYDFVYTKDSGVGTLLYDISVENGALVKDENPQGDNLTPQDMKGYTPPQEPKIYLYSVASGKSSRISFDEAVALRYQDGSKSKDGYEVRTGFGGGGEPFGGSNEPAIYLRGHGVSTKIELAGMSRDDVYNFHFIGWVEK